MITIIPGTPRGAGSEINHNATSGIRRTEDHAGMPVIILNPEDISFSVSGLALDVSVDDLETLQQSTIDAIVSGMIVRDSDGTQADVTAVSGANALFVQVDDVIDTQQLESSLSVNISTLSTPIDISSQQGFYNNALFIGADVATDLEILGNSDASSNYALVETLTFASGEFLYYDLKGYEKSITIRPTAASGNFSVQLVRSR